MDINQYDIYVTDNLELAKSIIIHSIEIAEAVNNGILERGIVVDQDNPVTWKYYMNLNGEYHSTDPDPFMITSKDTLELIEFTKKNLANHPATKEAFKLGSFEYKRLVSRHLESEMLIRGIVSPISFDDSIGSENYKILNWDPELIDENEYSLIDEIQKFTDSFFLNHHNNAYAVVDNLYLSANLAIYYIFLAKIILNIRLNNCLTNEAHSFHIWAYLSSYGRLDRWKDSLDSYQKHYLYRNIRSINDNAGETLTFNDLTKILLSRKYFPLYGYDLRHIIKNMPQNLYPEVLATRYRIDEELNVTNFNETKLIGELLDETAGLARDNLYIKGEATENTIKKMTKSKTDRVITKVLESELITDVENIPILVREIAYNHWVYLSCNGLYDVGVEIEYWPVNIKILISSLDALALYVYCGSLVLGLTLETIPDINVFKIKKINLPTLETLLGLKESNDISEQWIKDLITRSVKLTKVDSVIDFTELCHRIRECDFTDRRYCALFESLNGNANARLLTDTLWANTRSTILDEKYTDFFARLSIDYTAITKDNAEELMNLIFLNVTGFNPKELSTTLLMKSLIELLTYLSSYNIQIIKNDSYSTIISVGWTLQRINSYGFRVAVTHTKIFLKMTQTIGYDVIVSLSDFIKLLNLEKIKSTCDIYSHCPIDHIVDITENRRIITSEKINIPFIRAL